MTPVVAVTAARFDIAHKDQAHLYNVRLNPPRMDNHDCMNTSPALVVFDLYGTLVRFGVMHHPFQKILRWAREQGRNPQADDARKIMTVTKEYEELLAELGIFPPAAMLTQLHCEIQEELGSLTLFDDVLPTLSALLHTGIRLAICSNLAKPYGAVIDELLPQHVDLIRCLSYEVEAIKPEREIYDWIVRESGIPADQTLFIGDTRLADYEGPLKYGFRALHLVRHQPPRGGTIASLAEILD